MDKTDKMKYITDFKSELDKFADKLEKYVSTEIREKLSYLRRENSSFTTYQITSTI